MARIRGVYLRTAPKGPESYTSKEAALAAAPSMLVADAAFPKNRLESVKNAALRVNSGGRSEWGPDQFFAIWEYAKDLVLRINPEGGESSVEVIGFVKDGDVIGEDNETLGPLDGFLGQDGVETGGWVLLIGMQPNVPEGWGATVDRRRKGRGGTKPE